MGGVLFEGAFPVTGFLPEKEEVYGLRMMQKVVDIVEESDIIANV